MADPGGNEPSNWVDPDIIAHHEASGDTPAYDLAREGEFKAFFESGWLEPQYDDLRSRWEPLIKDEDSYGRVLAKTAFWSVVKLRKAQEKKA